MNRRFRRGTQTLVDDVSDIEAKIRARLPQIVVFRWGEDFTGWHQVQRGTGPPIRILSGPDIFLRDYDESISKLVDLISEMVPKQGLGYAVLVAPNFPADFSKPIPNIWHDFYLFKVDSLIYKIKRTWRKIYEKSKSN